VFMSDDSSSKSFTVKDRRRFTSEGDLKSADGGSCAEEPGKLAAEKNSLQQEKPEVAEPTKEPTPEPSSASAEPSADAAGGYVPDGGGEYQMNFSSFVISLATQALCQLGEAGAPEGFEIPIDHAAAKQTIDILRMLQDKTKGNLVTEEARLMEEVLHQLQLTYVKATTG
jgi:hypothetical protein